MPVSAWFVFYFSGLVPLSQSADAKKNKWAGEFRIARIGSDFIYSTTEKNTKKEVQNERMRERIASARA